MWNWNLKAKRYQNAATGRFMARSEVLDYVQVSLDATGSATDQLATLVSEGRLDPGDWRSLMRQEIKDEYIRQYVLGRGGREQMTQADWGSVGGMLKEQYTYLEGFVEAVASGELSEAQISNRAGMYIDSAREGFERGNARGQGVLELPAFPGDGQTECLTRCACHWRIEPILDADGVITGYNCYWTLDPGAEHCDDCLANNAAWYPLVVEV